MRHKPVDKTVKERKARWKAKQCCVRGHPLAGGNVYFAGTGRNRMCKQCRDERKSGSKPQVRKREPHKYYPHPCATQCAKGHAYIDDDFGPVTYSLSACGQRQCKICTREKEAAKKLQEIRWLNGPVIAPEFARSKLPSERISLWYAHERPRYGNGRRPSLWSTRNHYEPFVEPPQWQALLRLGRAA